MRRDQCIRLSKESDERKASFQDPENLKKLGYQHSMTKRMYIIKSKIINLLFKFTGGTSVVQKYAYVQFTVELVMKHVALICT